ncbi:MAG: hypothetical protein LUE29_10675 [Lachnospiraceae bacterium]|nr:hypothetical protein [Lachnospiraceae bacterium]
MNLKKNAIFWKSRFFRIWKGCAVNTVLYGVAFILSYTVNGSFLEFINGILTLIPTGFIYVIAAEEPMYPVLDIYDGYDMEVEDMLKIIMLEGFAIIAVNVVNYMLLVEGV